MTATTNGWPGKPGWPLHRERDGWHIVQMGDLDPEFAFWRAKPWLEHAFGCWETKGFEGEFQPHEISNWRYLAPALTPDEAAALQKRCEEAERERDALRRDASQEIATDEMVRRLQHLGDWQAADRIEALKKRIAKLTRLVEILIENDPDDMAADAVTVLDVWRGEARAALGGKDE